MDATEVPSKTAILEARDRLIARHRACVSSAAISEAMKTIFLSWPDDWTRTRISLSTWLLVSVTWHVWTPVPSGSSSQNTRTGSSTQPILCSLASDDARAAKSLVSLHQREWNYFSSDAGIARTDPSEDIP